MAQAADCVQADRPPLVEREASHGAQLQKRIWRVDEILSTQTRMPSWPCSTVRLSPCPTRSRSSPCAALADAAEVTLREPKPIECGCSSSGSTSPSRNRCARTAVDPTRVQRIPSVTVEWLAGCDHVTRRRSRASPGCYPKRPLPLSRRHLLALRRDFAALGRHRLVPRRSLVEARNHPRTARHRLDPSKGSLIMSSESLVPLRGPVAAWRRPLVTPRGPASERTQARVMRVVPPCSRCGETGAPFANFSRGRAAAPTYYPRPSPTSPVPRTRG
jgi:hypothetical protein